MKKYGRQHYVAQSYLKPFTIDGEYLFSYDLITKKCFRVHRNSIACENDFYSITNEFLLNSLPYKDKNAIDLMLNRFFENRYIEIRDITTKRFAPFFNGEKLHGAFISRQMVDFAFIQLIRTRKFRDSILANIFSANQSEQEKVDSSEQYIRDLHSHFLLCALYCCDLFKDVTSEVIKTSEELIDLANDLRNQISNFHRTYMLVDNMCSKRFMTSDNPVSSYGKKQLEILIMPLTPQVVIYLHNPNMQAEDLHNKIYPITESRHNIIDSINMLQAEYASRFIFSPTDEFSVIYEFITGQRKINLVI